MLHGGMIASLLDSAMTHCLFMQGVEAVTAELKVRYLHPVPCGSQVTLHARLKETFPPLYQLRAELTIEEDVVARGEAKFIAKENCKLS